MAKSSKIYAVFNFSNSFMSVNFQNNVPCRKCNKDIGTQFSNFRFCNYCKLKKNVFILLYTCSNKLRGCPGQRGVCVLANLWLFVQDKCKWKTDVLHFYEVIMETNGSQYLPVKHWEPPTLPSLPTVSVSPARLSHYKF